MGLARRLVIASFAVIAPVAGLCCSGGSSGGAADGSDGGPDGTTGADGPLPDGGPGGCGRFELIASGDKCPSTGCTAFSCTCPGAFPRSLAKCTTDGCLVGGNCAAICAAPDFGEVVGCAGTYTIDSGTALLDGGANGVACTADSQCASRRCAQTGTSAGVCVAGNAGDSCVDPNDCVSSICTAGLCADWSPVLTKLFPNFPDFVGVSPGNAISIGGSTSSNATVIRTGTTGVTEWSRTIPGEVVFDVLGGVGSQGDVGTFASVKDAGPATPFWNPLLSRVTNAGALSWSKYIGAPDAGGGSPRGVAVDSAGGIIATGEVPNPIDLGGGLVGSSFVVRYDSAGTHVWSRTVPSSQPFAAANGDALLFGKIEKDTDFGGGTATPAAGEAFIARYAPNGTFVSLIQGGKVLLNAIHGAETPDGDLIVVGRYEGPFSWGGASLPDPPVFGKSNGFIVRLSPTGTVRWAAGVSSADGNNSVDQAVGAPNGDVIVRGQLANGADLGGGPVFLASPDSARFVARYSPTGKLAALALVNASGIAALSSSQVVFVGDGTGYDFAILP
ncbi:MAG: hypothetical protein QOI41_3480 [Myxococcales bacterium]|nr:hypothetical protein [Myxococcales bacterium]